MARLIILMTTRNFFSLTCICKFKAHLRIELLKMQAAQLLQRDRAAGCVSFSQKWQTGIGDNSLKHCDIIGLQSYRIRWKTQNKGYYAVQGHSRLFKVIKVGINRKLVGLCDFLLVINSNWLPISYRFGVIAAYCSNVGHFAVCSTLWSSWLIGKRVVEFLMLIELFSLDVAAEALPV